MIIVKMERITKGSVFLFLIFSFVGVVKTECTYKYRHGNCDDTNHGVIIGAILGGLFALALLVSIIVVIVICACNKTSRPTGRVITQQPKSTTTHISYRSSPYDPQNGLQTLPVLPRISGTSHTQTMGYGPYQMTQSSNISTNAIRLAPISYTPSTTIITEK